MKKLLPFFILLFCFPASGQGDCPVPAIQQIMPGMTKIQVEKQLNRKLVLEKSKLFKDLPEAKLTYISKIKGIQMLEINFYQNKVLSVGVIYDNSIKWNSFVEFVETTIKIYNCQLRK